MGKCTTCGRRAATLLAVLLAAGCAGDDPDPRAFARTSRPDGALADRPIPVAAAILPHAPAAAPLAETRLSVVLPDQHETRAAIGQHAAHAFDEAAERAFAAAIAPAKVAFTGCPDREACEQLLLERAELAVIAGQLSASEHAAGLWQTPLGVELFALVVPPQSSVQSLTRNQVRQILTGQVKAWSQLGFDGETIVPVVPADAGMAERAARALIPGDQFAADAVRVTSERHVADQLLQQPGAIGIVRVTNTPMEAGMRIVQIDWCSPTAEAFGYGTYTAGLAVNLVTVGRPTGEALRFAEFARTEQGRQLLARGLLVR